MPHRNILPALSSQRPFIHLILDWDGTLTTKDTMSILGDLPNARYARLVKKFGATRVTPAELQWRDFTAAYLADYERHKASAYPKLGKVDDEAYIAWLDSLSTVESDSVRRVSESGFFSGVTEEDIDTVIQSAMQSGDLRLRQGSKELFKMFPQEGGKLSILSVNWSTTFIRRAIHKFESNDSLNNTVPHMNIAIHANEIEGITSPAGATGRLIGKLRTAADKHCSMQSLAAKTPPSQPQYFTVYVGDSGTDYLCLRNAGLGIWICECSPQDYRTRFSEAFKPLDVDSLALRPLGEVEEVGVGTLAWARDLNEVVAVSGRIISSEAKWEM